MNMRFLPVLAILVLASGCIVVSPSEGDAQMVYTETPNPDAPGQRENLTEENQSLDGRPFAETAYSAARRTPTYAFDGCDLKLVNITGDRYSFTFTSASSGYGNRLGDEDLVRTEHVLDLEYEGDNITFDLLDGVYDEIRGILLMDDCPPGYEKYEWEEGAFCYMPSETDGAGCKFSKQCAKGGCRYSGVVGSSSIGKCSDFMYGCDMWLYDRTVTRVDLCIEKDYP